MGRWLSDLGLGASSTPKKDTRSMMKRIFLAGVIAATPQLALAERTPSYWAVSLGQFEFTDVNDNVFDTTNLGVQGGYQFLPWLGAELRYGGQAASSDNALDSTAINYGGGFVRFDVPYKRTNVYVVAGVGGVGYEDADGNSDSDAALAGGVGVELYGTQQSAVKLEFMSYSGDDVEYRGVSLGFVHHFNWVKPGR
jgi:hypothetical protein